MSAKGKGPLALSGALPSIHIDIQIHISPDAKPDQIDQIFASIAKHLRKEMTELGKAALDIAKEIQGEVAIRGTPPDEGLAAESQQVIPFSLVRNTRGYLEAVANQINGSYEHGWFDACAVMIRRLVETLIIEAFEHNGLAQKIQDPNGDFLPFKAMLIDPTLVEQSWNLARNTKRGLPKLKSVGDLSAHSRRFIAHRHDIEKVIDDLRVVVQELVYLAGLK